ncbi:hypothetical protein [Streptosporangium carneum]|uniref:hypothetical protein n=1 Tax=Streptosporangium carneum TaxID=47481 RepID=UPI0022F2E04D|nr:hypothetical protein [Streptosporangium carneum]
MAIVKCGVQVALAVGAGYLLGRHHKLRMALALAAAGATGRLGAGGSDLLQQGLKVLGASPELEKITESIRGELLDVGKAAIKAAASRQVDSLTSKLHERAESLRVPGGLLGEEEEEEEEAPTPRRRAAAGRGRTARKARAEEPEEEEEDYEDEELEEEEPEEEPEEEEEEERPQRRTTRARAPQRERTPRRDRPVRRVRG